MNAAPLVLRVVLGVVILWAGLSKIGGQMEVSGKDALALCRMGVVKAPAGVADGKAADAKISVDDFKEPVKVLRVYGVALRVFTAANPGDENGKPRMLLWPESMGRGSWPVWFAWAAAISELIAGACVLLGLFTRVMGVVAAGILIVATWLTVVGPMVQGTAPARDFWDAAAWTVPLYQWCVIAMGLAVAFLGSGRLGLDRVVFRREGDEDDGE